MVKPVSFTNKDISEALLAKIQANKADVAKAPDIHMKTLAKKDLARVPWLGTLYNWKNFSSIFRLNYVQIYKHYGLLDVILTSF